MVACRGVGTDGDGVYTTTRSCILQHNPRVILNFATPVSVKMYRLLSQPNAQPLHHLPQISAVWASPMTPPNRTQIVRQPLAAKIRPPTLQRAVSRVLLSPMVRAPLVVPPLPVVVLL